MRETHFEIVRKVPERAASATRRLLVALVAVVAVAGVVTGATITVKQKTDTASLHAERVVVGERFVVADSRLAPSSAARLAVGDLANPVELAGGGATARTNVVKDKWMYVVTLAEESAGAVASGTFAIELFLDEAPLGVVYVKQETPEASAVEKVTVSFHLGDAVSTSSLYYVVVRPYVPPGEIVEYTLTSVNDAGSLKWEGVGAPIAGVKNPTLTVGAGDVLKFTIQHGGDNGGTHNIGVRAGTSGSGDPVAPGWSAPISATGTTSTTLSWAATASEFTYWCQYHSTMTGAITVTA